MKFLDRISQPFLSLMMATLLTSCHQKVTSQLEGHFENSDASQLEHFSGQQVTVPEYKPSQGVVVSFKMLIEHHQEDMLVALLNAGIDKLWVTVPSDYQPEEEAEDFALLREKLGNNWQKIHLLKQTGAGSLREWARDFGPWIAKTPDGERRILDFNYYPSRPSDDSVPSELALELKLARLSLPIYLEGGNFMINDRGHCLMTDKVLDKNSVKEKPEDLVFSEAEISDFFKKYAGCQKVIITPSMPYEGTRHIDLWAKFVDDQTILVSEIPASTQDLPGYTAIDRARVGKIRQFLEARAQQLRNLGYRIVRVPMPAPSFAADGYIIFRSYTNSLILNGEVFMPRYIKPSNELDGINGEYIDSHLTSSYEAEVERVHHELGFANVRWIPSDTMIKKGGAVHCTTMQVAR